MADVAEEQVFASTDDLKMPENPAHRRLIEITALAAGRALGDEWVCYRDMNWYPTDGGGPLAPDVQVLPAGLLPPGAKSYRQATLEGPVPAVVVEVPSDTDIVSSFRRRVARYQRLGVPLYVAHVDDAPPSAERVDAEGSVAWLDRPCPELGGIAFTLLEGELAVRTHDHLVVRSIEELDAIRSQREQQLAAKLRELGVDPEAV